MHRRISLFFPHSGGGRVGSGSVCLPPPPPPPLPPPPPSLFSFPSLFTRVRLVFCTITCGIAAGSWFTSTDDALEGARLWCLGLNRRSTDPRNAPWLRWRTAKDWRYRSLLAVVRVVLFPLSFRLTKALALLEPLNILSCPWNLPIPWLLLSCPWNLPISCLLLSCLWNLPILYLLLSCPGNLPILCLLLSCLWNLPRLSSISKGLGFS